MNAPDLIKLIDDSMSQRSEIRNPASNEILRIQRENPIQLISTCFQILSSSAPTERSIHFSLILIKNIINYDPRFIESFFDTYSNCIKEFCETLINIMLSKASVSSSAGLAYAKLLSMKPSITTPIDIIIFNSESCIESNNLQQLHVFLVCLCHVLTPEALFFRKDTSLYEYVICHCRDIFIKAFQIKSNPIAFQAAIGLNRIYENCSLYLKDDDLLSHLINHCGTIMLNCGDSNTFGSVLNFLLTITLKSYDEAYFTKFDICSIVANCFSINNPDVIVYLNQFWRSIAKYENSVVELNKFNQRYDENLRQFSPQTKLSTPRNKKSNNYCGMSLNNLVPRVGHFMKLIPEDGKGSEDVNQPSLPHSEAFKLMKTLFKGHPKDIFQYVIHKWEKHIQSNDWRRHHQLLLLASVICRKPTDSAAIPFLQRIKPVVLAHTTSTIPRLADTSIWLLSSIIFEKLYREAFFVFDTDIPALFKMCSNYASATRDPIILKRVIILFRAFFVSLGTETPILFPFFDQLMQFKKLCLANPAINLYNNFDELYSMLTPACLVFSNENVAMLYNDFIEVDFRPSCNSFSLQTEEDGMYKMITFLKFISSSFTKKVVQFGNDLLKLVNQLLNLLRPEIHEEGVLAMASIIKNLDVESASQWKNIMRTYFVEKAMTSGSPSIIARSALAISIVYSFSPMMQEELLGFFKMIIQTVAVASTPDHTTYILIALAKLIESAKDSIASMPLEQRVLCQNQLINFYISDMIPPVPSTDDTEMLRSVNQRYKGILDGLISIYGTFQKDEPLLTENSEKKMRTAIFGIKKKLAALPKIEDYVYLRFIDLVEIEMEKYSTRFNMVIKSNVVIDLTIRAASLTPYNTKLTERAKMLLEAFKTY